MNEQALKNLIEAFQDQSIFNAYQKQDYYTMDELQEDIQFAWDQWSDEITIEHWGDTEKPEEFTPSFAAEYLENEDFEAAEYNVGYLNAFFA